MRPVPYLLLALLVTTPASAQFRRGVMGGTTTVVLYPQRPPAVLLPAGPMTLEVRNLASAPARVVSRLEQAIEREIDSNDQRLNIGAPNAAVVVSATITTWTRTRRDSTKYVSDKRQTGTKVVKDKNGNTRTEPVYEYGRNEPSIVSEGEIVVRVEARRGKNGSLVDQTARHTFHDESLLYSGAPDASVVEDELVDGVARRAAGVVTPYRESVNVLLARSDAVEKANAMATANRWKDWAAALAALPAHRDPRQDAYRLHNLAVAHEALAYDARELPDALREIGEARALVARAVAARSDEKYFVEASERIDASASGYARLAAMQDAPGVTPPRPATAAPRPDAPAMTNEDVLRLRALGVSSATIVAAVEQAASASFDLSPASLKALAAAGVPEAVTAAMRGRK